MNVYYRLLWALCLASMHLFTYSVTIVYNLRIAQITRRQAATFNGALVAPSAFGQWSTFRNGAHQTATGGYLSYVYTWPSWYIKIDSAVARVRNKLCSTVITQLQTDDIFISGGWGHIFNEQTRGSLTAHLGIPTHKDTILKGVEFGTGHYAVGIQYDIAHAYKTGGHHFFLGAARFIHFFPRTIHSYPPLAAQCFDFALGNLIDIYLAHAITWEKRHRLEFGYDGTYGFGARIQPNISNFFGVATLLRNSFFLAYMRRTELIDLPNAWIFIISAGYDSRPNLLGRKYIVTLFGSWAVHF